MFRIILYIRVKTSKIPDIHQWMASVVWCSGVIMIHNILLQLMKNREKIETSNHNDKKQKVLSMLI